MNTLEKYAEMMQNRTLNMSVFSEKGYNHCPVDGKLSLQTYVKDCHDWWFSLVEDLKIIDILYSEEKSAGAVIFEVTYQGSFKLPYVQYMALDKLGKIEALTSYWNVESLRKAANTNKALEILFPENRVP